VLDITPKQLYLKFILKTCHLKILLFMSNFTEIAGDTFLVIAP